MLLKMGSSLSFSTTYVITRIKGSALSSDLPYKRSYNQRRLFDPRAHPVLFIPKKVGEGVMGSLMITSLLANRREMFFLFLRKARNLNISREEPPLSVQPLRRAKWLLIPWGGEVMLKLLDNDGIVLPLLPSLNLCLYGGESRITLPQGPTEVSSLASPQGSLGLHLSWQLLLIPKSIRALPLSHRGGGDCGDGDCPGAQASVPRARDCCGGKGAGTGEAREFPQ
ncbi:MAG: hypothetical protein QXS68_05685 [Candidatus Methanomethylicaceae archaeon]